MDITLGRIRKNNLKCLNGIIERLLRHGDKKAVSRDLIGLRGEGGRTAISVVQTKD